MIFIKLFRFILKKIDSIRNKLLPKPKFDRKNANEKVDIDEGNFNSSNINNSNDVYYEDSKVDVHNITKNEIDTEIYQLSVNENKDMEHKELSSQFYSEEKLLKIRELKFTILRISYALSDETEVGFKQEVDGDNKLTKASIEINPIETKPITELSVREFCIVARQDKYEIIDKVYNLYFLERKKLVAEKLDKYSYIPQKYILEFIKNNYENREALYFSTVLGRNLTIDEVSFFYLKSDSEQVFDKFVTLITKDLFQEEIKLTNSVAVPRGFIEKIFPRYLYSSDPWNRNKNDLIGQPSEAKELLYVYDKLKGFSRVYNISDIDIRKKRSDFLNKVIKDYRYYGGGNGFQKGASGRYYRNSYNFYMYKSQDFT